VKILISALLIMGALIASAFAFVYAGMFNVAADAPHSAFTYEIMDIVRARSIATRAKDVQPPPLDDTKLIATGAEHYAAMCSGCHLSPDKKEDSEIRAGLYPKPPDLTKPLPASPAEEFWVIKHGLGREPRRFEHLGPGGVPAEIARPYPGSVSGPCRERRGVSPPAHARLP
jgi:hypothetical protein